MLNHPTTVKHADLSSLLRIPRVGGDQGPDVALAGQVGEGRLVAVGDPSIVINQMLRFPGNRAVAKNLLLYLLEGSGERRRDAKLTILHGKFRERGTLGGGIRGSLRDRMRGLLGAIDGVRRGGFGGVAARIVALGIVIAAAIWITLSAPARAQRIPRPRYAAADPERAVGSRAAPKTARRAPCSSGSDAFDPASRRSRRACRPCSRRRRPAIAAREDLASQSREPAALTTLATEAGLDDRATPTCSWPPTSDCPT